LTYSGANLIVPVAVKSEIYDDRLNPR
jgi:hypothetical protein